MGNRNSGISARNSGSGVSHLAGLHALNLASISTKQQSGIDVNGFLTCIICSCFY